MEVSIKDSNIAQTLAVGPALAKVINATSGPPDMDVVKAALRADINSQYAESYARDVHEQNLKNMRERGITYQKRMVPVTDDDGNPVLDENGKPKMHEGIVITSIPDIEQWAAAVFAGITPCWFPECEGFRSELEEREKAAAGDDGKCPSCKRGAIIRQMLPKVKEALLRAGGPQDYIPREKYDIHYHEENRTAGGAQEVPGLTGKGEGAAVRKKGLLRRILDRIAKALGYRPAEG